MTLSMNIENAQELIEKWSSEEGRECENFLDVALRQVTKLNEMICLRREVISKEKP